MGITLECMKCGAIMLNRSSNATGAICYQCINESMREFDQPIKVKKAPAQGFPKGWRFMKEFVHSNGTVYFKGVEQPDLKGTLTPTTIQPKAPKTKKSKAQKAKEKAEIARQYADLKKQLQKETRKTVIKKIESQLKKLQKHI
jgi:hypothetical protein